MGVNAIPCGVLTPAAIPDVAEVCADVLRLALSERLAELRGQLAAMGVTAESPDKLDVEAERLAREERWT